MYKVLCFALLGTIVVQYVVACSGEQVKRGVYHSLHERQRQQCLQEGRMDCEQYEYDSYDKYQRKKEN